MLEAEGGEDGGVKRENNKEQDWIAQQGSCSPERFGQRGGGGGAFKRNTKTGPSRPAAPPRGVRDMSCVICSQKSYFAKQMQAAES